VLPELLNSCFPHLTTIPRRLTYPPTLLQNPIQPAINRPLILSPHPVFLIIARIRIIAAHIHKLAIDTHDLRVRIQVRFRAVIASFGTDSFEVQHGVNDTIDPGVVDAAVEDGEDVHCRFEPGFYLRDRGAAGPVAFCAAKASQGSITDLS
jgi:hypothetical protein